MRKLALFLLAALGLGGVAALAVILRGNPAEGVAYTTPRAERTSLERVAAAKVFFAHQSVGGNIMKAVPKVYQEAGLPVIPIAESTEVPTGVGIEHTKIGKNGDPLGKIAEFDALLRGGLAESSDAAVLKLCYVDFDESTDVAAVFAAYRDTMQQLRTDYPDLAVVAATVPVTTERGPLGKVKAAAGKGDRLGPERNAVREEFNAMVRAEFTAPGSLFDVAAMQSTSPDGSRVAGYVDGRLYYAMDDAYAKDPGHLNAAGGKVVASGFLAVLAEALAQ